MEMVSIIIPVLNAQQYIGRCLSSLKGLDYPTDKFEIIVVDNGSTDQTIDIVKRSLVQFDILPKGTISSVRNLGAGQARGSILAFIDADCVAPKQWLKKSVELLQNKEYGAVGCWYQLPPDASLIEKIWDTLSSSRRERAGITDWLPSSNLIMPADVFIELNGFDESLTTAEDVDICSRIRQAGFDIYSYPDIAVIHLDNPKTLKKFFLKEKWRGEGVLHNFSREFPSVKWNKAIAFTGITLLGLIGILLGFFVLIFCHICVFLFSSLAILFAIPCYLSMKACSLSKHWQYFIPLVFLFVVYAFARIFSAFNPQVWKK